MTKSSGPFLVMAMTVILSLWYQGAEAVKALAPVGCEDEEGFHFDDPSPLD
jgi:hypothetical protein